jgi:hypothetical protein
MSDIKVHRYLNTEDQPTGIWSLHRGDPSEPIKVLTDSEVEDLLHTIIRQFGDELPIGGSGRKAQALDWLQSHCLCQNGAPGRIDIDRADKYLGGAE